MRFIISKVAWLVSLMALVLVACNPGGGQATAKTTTSQVPAEHLRGEQLFNRSCAECHGSRASGTHQGPPLVHKIYEPNHHPDASFLAAIRRGVLQHHWQFGNMPPRPEVTDDELKAVTAYVRWLQREAGIR